MTGYITKGIGGFYYVKTSEGIVECKPGASSASRRSPRGGRRGDAGDRERRGGHCVHRAPAERLCPPAHGEPRCAVPRGKHHPAHPSTLVLDKLSAIAVDKGVQPVIVCTKSDLAEAEFLRSAYEKSTLPFIRIDYATGEGLTTSGTGSMAVSAPSAATPAWANPPC